MLNPAVFVFVIYMLLAPSVFMFLNNRRVKREEVEKRLKAPF